MLALVFTARLTQKKPTWWIERKQSFTDRATLELYGRSCVKLEEDFCFSRTIQRSDAEIQSQNEMCFHCACGLCGWAHRECDG